MFLNFLKHITTPSKLQEYKEIHDMQQAEQPDKRQVIQPLLDDIHKFDPEITHCSVM